MRRERGNEESMSEMSAESDNLNGEQMLCIRVGPLGRAEPVYSKSFGLPHQEAACEGICNLQS